MKHLILLFGLLIYSCAQQPPNTNNHLYHNGDVVYLKPDSTMGVIVDYSYGTYYVRNPNWNHGKLFSEYEIYGKK